MMCSTGEQLKINHPHVYDCDIPESLASSVPTMVELCKNPHGRKHSTITDGSSSTTNRSVSLLSLAGTEFISFAKGASFDAGEMMINNKYSSKILQLLKKYSCSSKSSLPPEFFLVPEKGFRGFNNDSGFLVAEKVPANVRVSSMVFLGS